jgi:hypothetical protein
MIVSFLTGRQRARADCFGKPIGHGVCKVSRPDIPHCGLDRSWIQEVALEHFRALFAELIGPGITLMN